MVFEWYLYVNCTSNNGLCEGLIKDQTDSEFIQKLLHRSRY